MSNTVNADVLSASSLLLAVITTVYGLWYPEINRAVAVEVRPHLADRKPEIIVVRSVLQTKAWPLLVSAVTLAAIFSPVGLSIAIDSLRLLLHDPLLATKRYNVIKAAFLAVWTFETALAVMAAFAVRSLHHKLSLLKQKDIARPARQAKSDV